MSKVVLISLIIFFVLLFGAVFYASPYFSYVSNRAPAPKLPEFNLASSTLGLFFSREAVNKIIALPQTEEVQPAPLPIKTTKQIVLPPVQTPPAIKEVSAKSLTELINGSVIQLYCGNMDADKTSFSDISRGTGIIINSNGKILTNRHIVYDENFKRIKTDCFVLRSPFPNAKSEKPKIYYFASPEFWPKTEKFSKTFSETKYYNDIALLKIGEKTTGENSKINVMLGFDYAGPGDYEIIETGGKFNYFPVDWNYLPNSGDSLISAGYGTDASHLAYQVTSSAGTVSGAISTIEQNRLDMIIVESNATTGFSGGALIHPQSKGLVGLVSWVSAGEEEGKFTVAIFRDFLSLLTKEEFGIDFKQLTTE